NGGNGTTYGGGGGRIAVYYKDDTSSITYQAYGGTGTSFGGAGTIYKKDTDEALGDLIIDNNNKDSIDDRYIGKTSIKYGYVFNAITIQNYGNLNLLSTSNISANTLNWSTKGIISDNGGTFNLVSSGGNLTIPATAKLFGNTPRTFTGITIDGTLTHSKNSATEQYKLDYTINGDVTVNVGGTINANYNGYAGSEGPGQGSNSEANSGGGSYGGKGGMGTVAAGSVYGSVTEPNNLGSGGGINDDSYLDGGSGGGVIKMQVTGSINVNGIISANGKKSTVSNSEATDGGGSGGSIWLVCNQLSGTGSITANGGNGNTATIGGGGGGGRIAIYYTTDTSSIIYQTYGGTGYNFAGAGTIYKKATSDTYGDLMIDNNNKNPNGYYNCGKTYLISADTFDNILIQNYGYLATTPTTEAYYSTLNWETKGVIEDNGGTFELLSGGASLTVPATAIFYENNIRTFLNYYIEGYMEITVPISTVGDFDINSTGTLTHKYNTTSQLYTVDITAANMMIAAGGKIDANNKGYQSGSGPGYTASVGASYGGSGGGNSKAGYGSVTQPSDLGSGGNNYGGGAIKIVVSGTLNNSGIITVNGTGTIGGSGGSIWLNSETLTGTGGTIYANGGNGTTYGGGGGRIAVYYKDDTSSITYQAYGGTGTSFGGAG
ncbi:MAG: hypothetical protein WA019_01225, partial [Candidatus Moraniibacteriota bacterium]